MADEQYDVSPAARRAFEEKKKQRATLRAEFLKQISNPHRHATGEGGVVFDPGFQHHLAMRVSEYDHFRPNAKTGSYGFLLLVVPLFLFGYLVSKERTQKEYSFRTGQVAYKDRLFKNI